MALRVIEPTAASVDAVRAHLSSLAGRSARRDSALARSHLPSLELAAPHDVYALGLDAVAEGRSIATAHRVAQRFLVMEGEAPIAGAELLDGDGFAANEGPFVAATAQALAAAEADPELAAGSYEVRLLRIPALYLVALWLKDDAGDGDVLLPLDPAPPPLVALRRYPPAELLETLEPPARARLAFDDVE